MKKYIYLTIFAIIATLCVFVSLLVQENKAQMRKNRPVNTPGNLSAMKLFCLFSLNGFQRSFRGILDFRRIGGG